MTDDCPHERWQCYLTGIRSFPISPEPDGVFLFTAYELSNFTIAQVDVMCSSCGLQRVLSDDEWECA